MNWAAWTLIVTNALAAVYSVAMVGKPRPTGTSGGAAVGLVFSAALIWLVIRAAS